MRDVRPKRPVFQPIDPERRKREDTLRDYGITKRDVYQYVRDRGIGISEAAVTGVIRGVFGNVKRPEKSLAVMEAFCFLTRTKVDDMWPPREAVA